MVFFERIQSFYALLFNVLARRSCCSWEILPFFLFSDLFLALAFSIASRIAISIAVGSASVVVSSLKLKEIPSLFISSRFLLLFFWRRELCHLFCNFPLSFSCTVCRWNWLNRFFFL